MIRLQAVEQRFANGLLALEQVDLAVEGGEFVAILGPSGCGKSSLLRIVAGLDAVSGGRVEVGGHAPGHPAPPRAAFVFQEPTLMPWASLFENVWLPLRLAGVSRAGAAGPIGAALAAMGLSGFEDSRPAELSGGMRMRASIARALVTRPQLLLMDEPFAALDEITRARLNADLLAQWQAQRFTVLFVTHSVYEAVFLAQRVLVMTARPGRILAEARIEEPYPRAASFRRSADFHAHCDRLSCLLQDPGEETPCSAG
jgi:NitT/TauT family transport system ATP-binding protein